MDSRESTTAHATQVGRGDEVDVETVDIGMPRLRFSASYASRYNNCHGSAHLEEAIPGFIMPDSNEAGRKGLGTQLHEIFAEVLSSKVDLLLAATCLEELAAVWGNKRTALIKDEKKYIVWWFMVHKSMPPIEHSVLDKLIQYIPKTDKAEAHEHSTPPRLIVFLAEALRKVWAITSELEEWDILIETKRSASWLITEPSTTVDLIIYNDEVIYIIDLKMGDIPVTPFMNEQLMYYAMTFRRASQKMFLVILQRNNIDEWELPRKVLLEWVEKMQTSEQAILDGDLSLKAGSHCTFCPANPHTRGDKGNKACPAMMQLLYGDRDAMSIEAEVLEGEL
jgi:hypothetical protein